MRNWNRPDELALLDRVVGAIRERGLLDPATIGGSDPLDLRGLSFPTVTLCNELRLPTAVVSRVAGRQEFADATLRRVDLSGARLDFAVWHNCRFEHVVFDNARLQNVRFFGCRFEGCTFYSANLRDASLAPGRNGDETEVVHCAFEKTDFRGASCQNPVLRSTRFTACKLDGFVFDGVLCDNVEIAGGYKELTFRGIPNAHERNRLKLNLSKASIVWLNADFGIDLSAIVPPADGSCIVILDRLRAVPLLCVQLSKCGDVGARVAQVIAGLYSDRAMSPLEPSQSTFLISQGMVADFAESNDDSVVMSLFNSIRAIANEEGFLGPS